MTDKQEVIEKRELVTNRERLISFPGEFSHETIQISDVAEPSDMVKVQFGLCDKMNALEIHTRENHAKVKEQWEEIQKARFEVAQRKEEAAERELRERILETLKKFPETAFSDMAAVLEITENRLRNNLTILEHEQKVKARSCPRLFDVIEYLPNKPDWDDLESEH